MANKSFTIQYLIKAREKYSAVANKVSKATDTMRKKINRSSKSFDLIRRKAKQAANAFSLARAKIKKAASGFSDFSAKTRRAGAVMSAAVTLPIALLGNTLKNAARDAGETESKFAVVFSGISARADAVAINLAKNYGLASDESKQLLSDTGDLLSGFGFSQESALNLSERVNTLAVDLASFTNFSGGAAGASAALTKALLGERESVKSLGISILESDVKKKVSLLLAQGRTFATLRQAKAEATLIIAIEQSKNAIGDFARTQEELANQERITSASTRNLMVSFGKLLLPVALKVTRAIRGVVEFLTALSPAAKKTILIVAALAAVIGPLLLAFGTLALIWPAIATGFAAFAGAMGFALLPIALLAAAAFLIISNWEKVSDFFSGFSDGLMLALGADLPYLIDSFKQAAGIIASLFSSDSEAAKNLTDFANIGRLAGEIIGGALKIIIRTLSGVGETIGQVIGAVTSLDLGGFDFGAIKAKFFGEETKAVAPSSRVDVGVNIGLDQGLKQTTPTAVSSNNLRRADVGLATSG